MSPSMSERSIQTIVANLSLTAISIAILITNPDIFAFGTIIGAILAVNGYEAIKQAKLGSNND